MVDISKTSNLPYLGTSSGTIVTPGSSSSGGNSGSSGDVANADALKNQFLSILLTQMQNQNPLDPMDTKEFTGQLAQFSSLEQQIDTNDKLSNLLTAIRGSTASTAFNYIGQTAELDSIQTVAQDSKVNWNYALEAPASSVTIKIKDSTGKVVFQKDDTNVSSGTYSINSTLADLGSTYANGDIFSLEVTAKDENGGAVKNDISTVIKVDGVESSSNGMTLRAGGLLFDLDDIIRFKTTGTTNTTATT